MQTQSRPLSDDYRMNDWCKNEIGNIKKSAIPVPLLLSNLSLSCTKNCSEKTDRRKQPIAMSYCCWVYGSIRQLCLNQLSLIDLGGVYSCLCGQLAARAERHQSKAACSFTVADCCLCYRDDEATWLLSCREAQVVPGSGPEDLKKMEVYEDFWYLDSELVQHNFWYVNCPHKVTKPAQIQGGCKQTLLLDEKCCKITWQRSG